MPPTLSNHFASRQPSSIRLAQIEFNKRQDSIQAINVAIGNVTLPLHPAILQRLTALNRSPFKTGTVGYTTTVGLDETNQAFINILKASDVDTTGLYSQIVDGSSHGMELVHLGVGSLLAFDPLYSNYQSMAKRLSLPLHTIPRVLGPDGQFTLTPISQVEAAINKYHPQALLIIPYDNPTGQLFSQKYIDQMANLCVKHDLWLISDEAYRELYYTNTPSPSIWKSTIKNIRGHRISLDSVSKTFNGCGLRIGAIITDNQEFHQACVAENTANLCAPALDQYLVGALAHETIPKLKSWFASQRKYYDKVLHLLHNDLLECEPRLIVSSPAAAIYLVVDARRLVPKNFNATDFVLWCARLGKIGLPGGKHTLLVAPMSGFYVTPNEFTPYQMRLAAVESPQNLKLVPQLFTHLLKEYLEVTKHHQKTNPLYPDSTQRFRNK